MRKSITVTVLVAILLTFITLCSCGAGGGSVVGVWKCELYSSEQVIEFTSDGRFIDFVSNSENRYRTDGRNIITYVDGVPGSEVAIPYKVKGSTLILGETEYTKVEITNSSAEER